MRVRVGHEFERECERQARPWKQDELGQLACSLTPGRHQGSVSGAGPVRPGVQGGCQIRRDLGSDDPRVVVLSPDPQVPWAPRVCFLGFRGPVERALLAAGGE